MHHRSFVRIAAFGVAATTALAVAPAALATTSTSAPLRLSSALTHHESHGLHTRAVRSNTSVTSSNWSGYAATGSSGAYTSVSASWTQPTITCTSTDTYSSYWVGLDGYSNSALEQTGTEADCISGQAVYGAWWEVLPAAETAWSDTVQGGDSLSASVVDNGDGTFTMTLTDSTQGWSENTTQDGSSGYQDSSAEVIAEATEVNGSVAKLSDFGTMTFTDAQANGTSLGGYSPTEIVMTGSSDTKAQPGSISGGTFSDTWKNYS